jgi:Uma2 family endonuclease
MTMASAASGPYRITVEQFLAIEWDDSDVKAELDNGVIRMMAGGTGTHARVQGNVFAALFAKLRGTGCRPYGSDMGVRTHDLALRYPDISVFCGRDGSDNDRLQAFDDPKLVAEILSPSTRRRDMERKLPEYRALPGLGHILYVDPEAETVRLFTRTGPRAWNEAEFSDGEAIDLTEFGLTLSWSDIFGRD